MATITADIQLDQSFADDEAADIKRCLSLLYTTPKGSAPLARDFGLDMCFLDYPSDAAKSLMAAEIVKQTALYESRVAVSGVSWAVSADGSFKVKVAVTSG